MTTEVRLRPARTRDFRALIPVGVGVLAACVACLPLFNLRSEFNWDWINHLWTIQYYGEYFKQNSRLPAEVNTLQVVGMPFPLFYAQKFYSVAGMLSAIVGAPFAVRVLAVLGLLVEFAEIYLTLSLVSGRNFSLFVATCSLWQIYLLTDLYNRSALTEYFALTLLTCALMAVWRAIIRSQTQKSSFTHWIRVSLYYSLASCTHPITAIFGGLFLFVLIVCSFLFVPVKFLVAYIFESFVCGLLCLLALSPWLYLTLQFRNDMLMSDANFLQDMFRKDGFYPSNIDNVWSRLWPFAFDARVIKGNILHVSTPYLDAQASVPLGLTVFGLLAMNLLLGPCKGGPVGMRKRAGLTLASLGVTALAFTISIDPSFSAHVGGFLDVLQFPYRLVAYINLGLLSTIVALADRWPAKAWSSLLMACNALLLIVGVTMKLDHAFAIRKIAKVNQPFETSRPLWTVEGDLTQFDNWVPLPWGTYKSLTHLPSTYYGAGAYSVLKGFGYVPGQSSLFDTIFAAIPVHENVDFGTTSAKTVVLPRTTLVVTNIQQFPWNEVVVDGQILPHSDVLVGFGSNAFGYPGLAVQLSAGRHQIELITKVPRVWTILNVISWTVLGGTLFISLVFMGGEARKRRLLVRDHLLASPSPGLSGAH